jgi:integrase
LTLSRKPRVRGRPPQFASAGQQAHETTTNDGQRPRTDRNGGQNGGKKRGHRLRWPHVVTEPKTAKSKRFVPISEPAERLLRAQREAQDEEQRHAGSAWRQTGFVFTTEFGEPCDPRNAFRALRVAATKAGLPHAGLHTLRHSAASVMLTRGVPLKVVSEILGHSSIAITGDTYGHVSPDVAHQAMSTLGEAFDR